MPPPCPSWPRNPGPQQETVPSWCSTQTWKSPPEESPMLTARTSSRTAVLSRSPKRSRPQQDTPPSRRTAHVRSNEAASSVSPLRGPSSIEKEPNSGAGAVTVSGELESQRPTSAPGGKNRRDGSNRSPQSPSAARCCNPNSTRPLSRRRATMRTAPSDSCPVAVLGIATTLETAWGSPLIVEACS